MGWSMVRCRRMARAFSPGNPRSPSQTLESEAEAGLARWASAFATSHLVERRTNERNIEPAPVEDSRGEREARSGLSL